MSVESLLEKLLLSSAKHPEAPSTHQNSSNNFIDINDVASETLETRAAPLLIDKTGHEINEFPSEIANPINIDRYVTCEECRFCIPNPHNPGAGWGRCRLSPKHGDYPRRRHLCPDFQPPDQLITVVIMPAYDIQ